jgi:hypothetical protein
MRYVLAAPVVLFMLWLAVGAVTGRVRARSCCAIPADRDLRMRDVVVAAPPTSEGAVPTVSTGKTPPSG